MTVTIKDIAKHAGVSHTTVSRALNGNPTISDRTASNIREIALSLGYLPSAAARGLKTRHSGVIGVLVSRIDNPYFGEIIQGVEDTIKGTGYSAFVSSSYLDPLHEKNTIQAFSEHRVDGVIIGSVPVQRKNISLLNSYGIPVVVINNQSPWNQKYSISHDDSYGAYQVTQHLLELGHQKIAYLGNARANNINNSRLNGFQAALRDARLEAVSSLINNLDGGEIENGVLGMRTMLNRGEDFTAIFCFNDLVAIGAMHVLQESGINVPGDVSVVGFDNIPYSAFSNPPLTTFDQPKHSIGAAAAGMLMDLINASSDSGNHSKSITKLIRGQLLIRKSTSPVQRRRN